MRLKTLTLLGLVLAACAANAQNPLTADSKTLYGRFRGNVLKAAEKMPEENYSFKPSDDVRTFGQLVGHVADANIAFCAAVKGEKKAGGIEKGKTTKADLVAGLKEAYAYCDSVYEGMTDAQALERIKFFGSEMAKISVLGFNMVHTYEHYGNMATYMRIKGIVPPSSEGR
ncbi:MAG TPA: DinB family protein [Solibacterales bacterium]|nr:DinB family protein [Bryobacterales bacterium]